MEIRMESEIEKLVLANRGLVHYFLKKKDINPSDYDDFYQIGLIGLTKAAMTFDNTRKIKFSTYAAKCINNEIYMYFRKNKNYSCNISLNEPLNEDDTGNVLTLEDILSDENVSQFTEVIQYRESIERAISIILNCFSKRDRTILLLSIGGVTQNTIVEQLNISQSYVSRLQKKLGKRVKQDTESNRKVVDRPFSVIMEKCWIKIAFFTTDIENLCQALESLAANIDEIENFKIKIINDKIEINFLAEPEIFILIEQVLQEMENFGVEIEC